MERRPGDSVTKPSRRLLAAFALYLRWYIGRHFHALRIAHSERFPRSVQGPTIIYLNHPSWWDPLTCIMVSRYFLPLASHYAPMDESALARYGFFGRLGLFPVELNSPRGARQFLRSSAKILSTPNSVLWLTPQGHFTDPRPRPLVLKTGLASLLSRFPSATLIPLAIEYTYWDERLPEILLNIGLPLRASDSLSKTSECNAVLAASLSAAQDELARLAITRDAGHFEALLEGGAGVGAFYDLWQRFRAGSRGERYQAEHGSIHRS
ncbi:lysophospholipid acyltransferase family protein [Acidisarcina polymorpha]|nr:lysophospholipid acyltransferase family protein [Acidisarcina polymorpha]